MPRRTKTIRKLEREVSRTDDTADIIATIIRNSFSRLPKDGFGKVKKDRIGYFYFYLMAGVGLVDSLNETQPGYYDNGVFIRGNGIYKLTKKARRLYEKLRDEGYYKELKSRI